MNDIAFEGCKLALFLEDRLLVYKRDNFASIPFPDMIDLPGGKSELNETPEQCVLRELFEEFSIELPVSRLLYRHSYALPRSDAKAFFFAAELKQEEARGIRFGSEGQHYMWMSTEQYLAHPEVIAHHKIQLAHFLKAGFKH